MKTRKPISGPDTYARAFDMVLHEAGMIGVHALSDLTLITMFVRGLKQGGDVAEVAPLAAEVLRRDLRAEAEAYATLLESR